MAARISCLHVVLLVLALALPLLPHCAVAHGGLNWPNPRGGQNSDARYIPVGVDSTSDIDYLMHFPAGVRKGNSRTSGLHSQMAAAGRRGWTPFEPLKAHFRWRVGVCGDPKQQQPGRHRRYGEFYNNGFRSATYKQGQTIQIGLSVIAHHNGFMELHVCDVAKCDGEISENCFRRGHCKQLERAPSVCDSGLHPKCGPIDENYKGRWYIPCSKYPLNLKDVVEYFPRELMKYKLPENLNCDHCVLQWFWTAANSCNPPGVVNYFKGPNRPRGWGRCKGQGGAVGGFTDEQMACGGQRFAEEYVQCADIRIERSGAPSRPADERPPATRPPRRATAPSGTYVPRRPSGGSRPHIYDIVLIGDGRRIRSLYGVKAPIDISQFRSISVEALGYNVNSVRFSVGKYMKRDRRAPFYLFGDSGGRPYAWVNPPLNEVIELRVLAGSDMDRVSFSFNN